MTAKRHLRRGLAGVLTATMLFSAIVPASAITAGKDGLAAAGEETYISMHEYVSKTDIDGVYKVTLSVGGDIKQRNTEVVVVMDNSSSMNINAANPGHAYSSLPGNQADALGVTNNPTDGDFGLGYASAAYWLHPFSADYTNGAKHNAAVHGTPEYAPGYGGTGNMDGLVFPANTHDYLQYVTANEQLFGKWLLYGVANGAIPYSASYPSPFLGFPIYSNTITAPVGFYGPGTAYNAMTAPGQSAGQDNNWYTLSTDHQFNPYAPTEVGSGISTRLGAAAKGVEYAMDTFADAKKNPGIARTNFAMVTFDSYFDSFNSPYTAQDGLNALGSYGFGDPSYTYHATVLTAPDGQGYNPVATGVKYSTRMDVNSPVYQLFSTNIGNYTTAFDDYATKLVARVAALGYTDTMYPNAGASSQDAKGLIPMSNATDVANLYSDMEYFVRAATAEQDGTWIVDGLDEAMKIFWGDAQGAKTTSWPGGGAVKNKEDAITGDLDKPNRYVILLTDGDDTDGQGLEALDAINDMKNAGVQFMVIAIDSGIDPAMATPTYNPQNLQSIVSHINAPGNQATTDPSVPGNDMTPWLALAAMPIEAEITHPTLGTQLWYEIGDIDTGSISTTATPPGPAAGLTNQLTSTVLGAAPTWANVGGYDFTGIPTLRQHISKTSAFAYIDPGHPEKIQSVLQSFVDRIVKMGSGTKVDAKLNSQFDVYQMPGEPMFTVDGVAAAANEVIYSNGKIDWRLVNEIPLTGITTLSFYVKIDSNVDPSLGYAVFSSAVLTSTGPFFRKGDNEMAPFRDINISKSFAPSYITPGGGIKQDSTEKDVTSDAPVGTGTGYTGADGHQANRESAKSTANYMSSVTDVTPEVKGVSAGTSNTGRAKAVVTVSNGTGMRYQWQYKNDAGDWEDIFGGTSSQYVLSSMFKVGKKYELRCRITNAAGKIFYSDVLEITATAATKSAGLQSKK